MAGYRDLNVWQKGMDLTVEIYQLTKLLPKEETYRLGDQMRRAVVSIPSNIAEGQAREAKNDFVRFLFIAQGSRAELETQLEICTRLGYLSEEQVSKAKFLSAEIARMLSGLIAKQKSLSKNQPKTNL